MRKPIQCHLWQRDSLTAEDLHDAFETVETFEDESHLMRSLRRCKDCSQLYFYEFYEEIDWNEGNDPQYCTYIPVDTKDDIETLKKTDSRLLFTFTPRLHKHWPAQAGRPEVFWIGKE